MWKPGRKYRKYERINNTKLKFYWLKKITNIGGFKIEHFLHSDFLSVEYSFTSISGSRFSISGIGSVASREFRRFNNFSTPSEYRFDWKKLEKKLRNVRSVLNQIHYSYEPFWYMSTDVNANGLTRVGLFKSAIIVMLKGDFDFPLCLASIFVVIANFIT